MLYQDYDNYTSFLRRLTKGTNPLMITILNASVDLDPNIKRRAIACQYETFILAPKLAPHISTEGID